MESAASPPAAAPTRLWSLDALRGACAGIVFVSHWHLWANFPPHGAFERAIRAVGEAGHEAFTTLAWPTGAHHPAVIGFFVLSGFCIHYPFERRALAGAAPPDWPDYFRRRFRRIMPVYWAACALGLIFAIAENTHPSGSALLHLHATAPVCDVLVRFAGLAGLYPHEIFAGNYILTTVAVELLMYAGYPLFFRYAARGAWRGLGATFLILHLVAILLLPFVTPFWVFNSPFMLGIFWYAGALTARLYLAGRGRLRFSWVLLAWLGFMALKAIPHFYGLNLLKQAAWGLVCALGILWAVRQEELRPCWRDHPVAAFLRRAGDVSYSLYAMHTPALMLATWALLLVGIRSYSAQLAATLAASLAATLVVHYSLERHFYRPLASGPRDDAATRTASRPG